jgi:hypothetical protein
MFFIIINDFLLTSYSGFIVFILVNELILL